MDNLGFIADLREVISDFPVTLSWSGGEYLFTRGTLSITAGFDLDGGGVSDAPMFSVVGILSDFTSNVPEAEDIVKVDGDEYAVKKVSFDDAKVAIQLDLTQADQ